MGFLAPGGDNVALRPDTLRRVVDRLVAEGYRQIITGAVPEQEIEPFLHAGFRVRERLHLLSHRLDSVGSVTRGATRRARRGDRQAVLTVDHLAFQPFWQLDAAALEDSLTATPVARFRVTDDTDRRITATLRGGGPVTGYAIFGWAAERGYLQRLAVHPARRGQGLGAALVNDGLHWLVRRGATQALVNTQESNDNALRLYQSVGFRLERFGLVVLDLDTTP